MLSKKPADRHGSWDELIADLDRVLAGKSPRAHDTAGGKKKRPAGAGQATRRKRKRSSRSTKGAA